MRAQGEEMVNELLQLQALEPVSIILAVVGGLAVFLLGLLGGPVELWVLKIHRQLSPWERIGVCTLGIVLCSFGVWRVLTGGQSGGVDVRDVTAKPATPSSTQVPIPSTYVLDGRVFLSDYAEDFRARRSDYEIRVTTREERVFAAAEIDVEGHFRVRGLPETLSATVSWTVSRPTRFIIWPLAYERVTPGRAVEFRLEPLELRFGRQKGRMLELVVRGDFTGAGNQLQALLGLFERLVISDASSDDEELAREVARWRYVAQRDLADTAAELRSTRGRSQITDEQIRAERGWWRGAINAALALRTPGARQRDFARVANSWAGYSRQVYSYRQRSWPSRHLASRETGGEFLEDRSYADLLHEDMVLIMRGLGSPEIRDLIDEHTGREESMIHLNDGEWQAMQLYGDLLQQDADRVSLSVLANLLAALHRLTTISSS